jgi:hypothetical protein
MNILQVSTNDIGGGAEKIAFMLYEAYKAQGFNSHLAVGYKYTQDDDILLISNEIERNFWSKFLV